MKYISSVKQYLGYFMYKRENRLQRNLKKECVPKTAVTHARVNNFYCFF